MGKGVASKNFYSQPASKIAPKLLGKVLVRKIGKKKISVLITEAEAYDGINDRASHASRGRTKRNEAMFDEGGHWYVYFIYGMYWMLNLVCSKKNYPSAVLIRKGLVVDKNLEVLEKLKGPGVLSRRLKIDGKLNTRPVSEKSGLWIEDWGGKIPRKSIKSGKRIGVDYAGRLWANRKWRFYASFPDLLYTVKKGRGT